MFSMCSELTPCARIPDTRIPQLMQPWLQKRLSPIDKQKSSATTFGMSGTTIYTKVGQSYNMQTLQKKNKNRDRLFAKSSWNDKIKIDQFRTHLDCWGLFSLSLYWGHFSFLFPQQKLMLLTFLNFSCSSMPIWWWSPDFVTIVICGFGGPFL